MDFSLGSLVTFKDEMILLYVLSLFGIFIHDFFSKKINILAFLLKFGNHLVASVVTIICFSLDPLLTSISDRIILIFPVILGMVGKEALNRMTTLQGSTSLIEYILGFLGIVNEANKDELGLPPSSDNEVKPPKKEEKPKEEEEEENKGSMTVSSPTIVNENKEAVLHVPPITTMAEYENFLDLDNLVHASLDNICNLIVDYYAHQDIESFLRGYHTLAVNMEFLQHKIAQRQTVPVPTVLKMLEIGKKQTELDLLYNEIVHKYKEKQ